ncbi:MAG: carboxypeptidase-like regulatory domain-containing protein [Chitinophagaceae bacterium]|nr:carboxypeptidase-like regulatory domain-containing protein [Chitinophagaceae bacterium]
MSRNNMQRALVLLTMLFLSLVSFSQDRVITGKVTDPRDGTSLAGVSVAVKGTNTGTQTDANGDFRISVGPNVTTLVFTSVGYETQEVDITGKTSVSVSLTVNNAALGEVVVIAYGTRKRGDLTGSVTAISSKDFRKAISLLPSSCCRVKLPVCKLPQAVVALAAEAEFASGVQLLCRQVMIR